MFEYDFDNGTVTFLRDRGVEVTYTGPLSRVQSVRQHPNGSFEAAADPRLQMGGGFVVDVDS